jgi:hypothetical protein
VRIPCHSERMRGRRLLFAALAAAALPVAVALADPDGTARVLLERVARLSAAR